MFGNVNALKVTVRNVRKRPEAGAPDQQSVRRKRNRKVYRLTEKVRLIREVLPSPSLTDTTNVAASNDSIGSFSFSSQMPLDVCRSRMLL